MAITTRWTEETALGTTTRRDAANQALRVVVERARARREKALADLQRIADNGGLAFDRLDELDQ